MSAPAARNPAQRTLAPQPNIVLQRHERPKKIPNAFILYRRDRLASIKDAVRNSRQQSVELARLWLAEPEHVRSHYRLLAQNARITASITASINALAGTPGAVAAASCAGKSKANQPIYPSIAPATRPAAPATAACSPRRIPTPPALPPAWLSAAAQLLQTPPNHAVLSPSRARAASIHAPFSQIARTAAMTRPRSSSVLPLAPPEPSTPASLPSLESPSPYTATARFDRPPKGFAAYLSEKEPAVRDHLLDLIASGINIGARPGLSEFNALVVSIIQEMWRLEFTDFP